MSTNPKSMLKITRRMAFVAALALLIAAVLAACGTQATPPAAQAANSPAPATEASAPVSNTAAAPTDAAPAPAGASGTVSFAKDVMPILQNSCVTCHGGQRTSAALNLTSYDQLMAGSENGPVITAGDAANSLLVQLVQTGKMPKRGAKLTADQIKIITDWINAGAANN
jgi:uncharacterized membrane protein